MQMKIVTVELKDDNAMQILKDLESINILRVLPTKKEERKSNLSTSLRGSFKKGRAKQLIDQLNQSRNEWQRRDI